MINLFGGVIELRFRLATTTSIQLSYAWFSNVYLGYREVQRVQNTYDRTEFVDVTLVTI